MPVNPDHHELRRAVLATLPGWQLVYGPEPFTWAAHMHFRARLTKGSQELSIVLRQAWCVQAYEVEKFLYRRVLPQLSVQTAGLVATFDIPSDGSKWIVLQDLGSRTAQGNREEDRKAFLGALGRLHGQGSGLLDGDLLAEDAAAAGTIPALYITAIAEARSGAWPLAFHDAYAADAAELADYVRLARTEQGFAEYLERSLG